LTCRVSIETTMSTAALLDRQAEDVEYRGDHLLEGLMLWRPSLMGNLEVQRHKLFLPSLLKISL